MKTIHQCINVDEYERSCIHCGLRTIVYQECCAQHSNHDVGKTDVWTDSDEIYKNYLEDFEENKYQGLIACKHELAKLYEVHSI